MKNRILLSLTVITITMNPLLASEPKYKADVPSNVLTPSSVKTKYAGTLHFKDGFSDKETVANTYDFLDTARATTLVKNNSKTLV